MHVYIYTCATTALLQEKLEELDNNPLWENDEQFTVVVQPFFKKIELPRVSMYIITVNYRLV